MPTYDYLCISCTHQFEHFQSMSDDPLTECPICGSKVRRLVSGGSGLIFKGSGFYITDYKNGKKDPKDKKETKKKETPKKIKKEQN
ncbi:MAG: zinc ribbon domain-containing protein [Candidatus Marinimicrobia bacterium]|nr:FmdB family transcriptional regulator [Candidatus Neomarinimicrobiota bacterium]MDP6260462.1 zinc ribbon domain-containing protein [Candidatus Neomarinimicrobiota bacterium]MDP7128462.1 zinc ribbon domain-containing protein [Candidatus Neomarinimicrobiota bacterium]MDP7475061.1 zinc ribbon domain-containing protein [Candidatus Neomarinimicrobiota bacterium]MDP7526875.1 zinc ribbon domain-containing protein [Candidatus Neomarinimicrobiota bacterium]